MRWFRTSSTCISCSMGINDSSPPGGGAGSASLASWAAFSARFARCSFNFRENIATERARFTRLCFSRDFLAASSAAALASSSVCGLMVGALELVPGCSTAGLGDMLLHDGAPFSNSESDDVASSCCFIRLTSMLGIHSLDLIRGRKGGISGILGGDAFAEETFCGL